MLAINQEVRDNPGDRSAVVQNRFGKRSHQSDRAAAINEPDIALGEDSAELPRRLHECWIVAGTGGAIDADRVDCAHWIRIWREATSPVKRRSQRGNAALDRPANGSAGDVGRLDGP